MLAGIIAGITWAIETVLIGLAMAMSPLSEYAFLAPFVSTFLHDACSAIWSAIYNGACGNLKNVWRAFKTKSGKFVVLAATIGGPVGMTGYLMAVNYMGASVGAIASAIFPAIGAVLAFIFLKERMKWYQWVFLGLTLVGVYALSYDPTLNITNFWLGILGAAMCSFGWGIEAVILAKCLTDPDVTDEYALQIRQTTSALVYGVVLLPIVGGWGLTANLFAASTGWLLPTIAIAALFATVSYLFYYKAISQIGATKSMALNVTYCGWGIPFAAIAAWDFSTITPLKVVCALVVLVCGVFAAADFREIFKKAA